MKIGKAMGLEVTVLSTSENKREEATSRLGADHFVVSKDKEQMGKIANSLNGIIDTVSANHPLPDYLVRVPLTVVYCLLHKQVSQSCSASSSSTHCPGSRRLGQPRLTPWPITANGGHNGYPPSSSRHLQGQVTLPFTKQCLMSFCCARVAGAAEAGRQADHRRRAAGAAAAAHPRPHLRVSTTHVGV